MRELSIRELVTAFRQEFMVKQEEVVIRDAIPPDFDVLEWEPFLKARFSNKTVYFDSIVVLEGTGQIKIRVGAKYYLIDVHKDYMELFRATSAWTWIERVNVFNRAINHKVKISEIIRSEVIVEIMSDGVKFVPYMIVAERLGVCIGRGEEVR